MRAVTWNVRHGRPRRGFASNRLLTHTAHDLDAEVLAVQEVERRVIRSWFVDQSIELAQAIDADACHYAPTRRLAWIGSDGIALAVRGAIDDVRVVELPRVERAQRRVAIVASVVVGEERMTVITTHLQNDAALARAQLGALLDAIADEPGPRLLLGDLNLASADVEPPLRAAGFDVVDTGPTNPAWDPFQRIDHLAVDGFTVQRAWVPVVPVSDHRPVAADLDLVMPARAPQP